MKCDIKKFFASIDHEILEQLLAKHIQDKDILNLLSNIIDSFQTNKSVANSAVTENATGLPLGNLTSQLLVNIYMNEFDQHMKHKLKIIYYIRYADDFVILQNDIIKLKNLLLKISEFLKHELRLELHPHKVFIKTLSSGLDFLGWVHFPCHRVLRTSTKKRMIRNLAKNDYKKERLESYLGLLSHGNAHKLRIKILEQRVNI